MLLILSDGRFNKAAVRRLVHEAIDRQVVPTLLIIDSSNSEPVTAGLLPVAQSSILNMREVQWTDGEMVVSNYLDNFPFPFYAIIQNVESIPAVVSDVIRQWFEMLSRK